jgi:hypothetical protein
VTERRHEKVIWIAKTFQKYANWGRDQDAVQRLQIAVAATGSDYTKVLMALVSQDETTEVVFIGLPALHLAAPFVGYKVTTLLGKPVATLLIGDQTEFEKHFRFPAIGD